MSAQRLFPACGGGCKTDRLRTARAAFPSSAPNAPRVLSGKPYWPTRQPLDNLGRHGQRLPGPLRPLLRNLLVTQYACIARPARKTSNRLTRWPLRRQSDIIMRTGCCRHAKRVFNDLLFSHRFSFGKFFTVHRTPFFVSMSKNAVRLTTYIEFLNFTSAKYVLAVRLQHSSLYRLRDMATF